VLQRSGDLAGDRLARWYLVAVIGVGIAAAAVAAIAGFRG